MAQDLWPHWMACQIYRKIFSRSNSYKALEPAAAILHTPIAWNYAPRHILWNSQHLCYKPSPALSVGQLCLHWRQVCLNPPQVCLASEPWSQSNILLWISWRGCARVPSTATLTVGPCRKIQLHSQKLSAFGLHAWGHASYENNNNDAPPGHSWDKMCVQQKEEKPTGGRILNFERPCQFSGTIFP